MSIFAFAAFLLMNCPLCESGIHCKNGLNGYDFNDGRPTNRKQRYLCLVCGYNYTVPIASTADYKNWGYPPEVREEVISLYRHDASLSYRKIAAQVGRGITHGTVRNWIVAHQIAMEERPAKPTKKPAPYAEDDAGYLT